MSNVLKNTTGVGNFVVNAAGLSARVNPLVPMNILDSFMRRPDGEKRALGALLGFVSEGGVLDIVDTFTIVHSDRNDGVALEIEYHKKMVQLRTSVHPKEQVVGWYSVGPQDEFSDDNITQTVTVQQFFKSKESLFAAAQNLVSPVYLNVNTSIESTGELGFSLFTSVPTPACEQLMQFVEVPVRSETFQLERSILEMVLQARSQEQENGGRKPLLSELDNVKHNVDELLEFFKKAKQYASDVIAGKESGNAEVGRALSRQLANDACLADGKLEDLVAGATKDTLMVMYLSNLARTQIVLGEQIHGVLNAEKEGA